ncbi:MAG: hypothetical protein ABSB58_10665 [Gemmatimonadales bacterium]
MTHEPDGPTRKALDEGARQSHEALTPSVRDPAHVVLWRRHKWKILSLLFLLLTELCLLLLGKSLAMGPG